MPSIQLMAAHSRGRTLKPQGGAERIRGAHLEGFGQAAQPPIHPSLREWGSLCNDHVALLPPRSGRELNRGRESFQDKVVATSGILDAEEVKSWAG